VQNNDELGEVSEHEQPDVNVGPMIALGAERPEMVVKN
jgi:hypothetical protein